MNRRMQMRLSILWGVIAGTLFAGSELVAIPGGEAPWSASERHPVIGEPSPVRLTELAPGPATTVLRGWLVLYQKYVSRLNTTMCSMQPSCSAYSRQALDQHGAGMGIAMTADRLIHEGGQKRYSMIVGQGGDRRYLDPVASNDFWWVRP